LREARRPIQAIEAEVKRLTDELAVRGEELAAKDLAAAESAEENRKLRSTLERTRSALEEREFLVRRLERSESNNANVLGRIQTSIERLKSVPGAPGATAAGSADAGAAVPVAADRAVELIRIDADQPTTYVLAKRTRIGRAAGCELQIESGSVSRHHALVVVGPRDTIIEDLNSTNGVLVNGRKVARHVLSDGDAITIGETRFRYFARVQNGPPGPNSGVPTLST
jgi:pSer/pThr/pTyr-binding forkhead associated (FHA) protein